ncbi:hypothetical protein [Nonomuraea sp. NPDC050202]|jgi:hypothetical protein|uniref:hypothetical protein n=1 Tax=Nonomuraea sp. NPDC050202 TaxID=3155035 RepID=UPI0033E4CC81
MEQALSTDLDDLRAKFPAWSVFCSDAGVFYATRRYVQLRNADIERGLQQTVSAETADGFMAILEEQSRMAVRS